MPLTISFDIDDEQVASINEYLLTQRHLKVDEVTGATKVVQLYDDVEDFIHQQVGQMIHSIVIQYPPASLRDRLAQIKNLQDAVKAAAKPKKTPRKPGQ